MSKSRRFEFFLIPFGLENRYDTIPIGTLHRAHLRSVSSVAVEAVRIGQLGQDQARYILRLGRFLQIPNLKARINVAQRTWVFQSRN